MHVLSKAAEGAARYRVAARCGGANRKRRAAERTAQQSGSRLRRVAERSCASASHTRYVAPRHARPFKATLVAETHCESWTYCAVPCPKLDKLSRSGLAVLLYITSQSIDWDLSPGRSASCLRSGHRMWCIPAQRAHLNPTEHVRGVNVLPDFVAPLRGRRFLHTGGPVGVTGHHDAGREPEAEEV
eukprot:6190513-Pleurochrysis_carterae.AAC.2